MTLVKSVAKVEAVEFSQSFYDPRFLLGNDAYPFPHSYCGKDSNNENDCGSSVYVHRPLLLLEIKVRRLLNIFFALCRFRVNQENIPFCTMDPDFCSSDN